MFTVHDADGVKLKGPLETINREKPPRPLRAASAAGFWDTPSQHSPLIAYAEQSQGQRYSHAEQLYRRMLKINVNEPVVHGHQIMSSYVYTLTPSDSLLDAWRWMAEYDIGQIKLTF